MSRKPTNSSRHGILNIDKPVGLTSHDVVRAVRRAAGQQRVGHAGTLDPLASGVLVVCLGSATRVIQEVMDSPKAYRAVVRLGVATATYDAEGPVTAETDIGTLRRADLEAVLDRFRGPILQVPPRHSALKYHGRPLYELARAGHDVPLRPRPVTIRQLSLVDWSPPDAVLELTVSRGAYVRSLAHDIGQALGVGAHLASLVRTAVGPFDLSEAHPLAEVERAFAEGWERRLLLPIDTVLTAYPAAVLSPAQVAAVRNGQRLALPNKPNAQRLRAYDQHGQLVAILRWQGSSESWQPERVFPTVDDEWEDG